MPPTCDPAMGTTACDACVYGQCCDAALSCAAGTPCDALWACARSAGCLSPQTSDFDGCVVVACPMLATSDALAGLVELSDLHPDELRFPLRIVTNRQQDLDANPSAEDTDRVGRQRATT